MVIRRLKSFLANALLKMFALNADPSLVIERA